MTSFRKLRHSIFGLAVLVAAFAAKADVVYSFDATAVGAFGAGPYGTVTLHDNGTGIDFTIGLRSDMNFVNTGGPHSVFSFNALGVATSDVSNVMFNGLPVSGFSVVAPGANQPFGTFSLAIDCTAVTCANGLPGQTPDPVTISVANAEYSDFGFILAGSSAFFASDVICNTGSCNGASGAIGVTGPPQTVPEPGSIALAGLGLFSLIAVGRRRKAA